MLEEEALLSGQKRLRRSKDRAQRRAHLQSDHDEQSGPDMIGPQAKDVLEPKNLLQKTEPEEASQHPDEQKDRPMKPSESVDCEKIHTMGANPMRTRVTRASAATNPRAR